MEYYSAIKKNLFESVLMRWMKLEPIIQSEVSQKDKDQYSILMHIYVLLKDGNDNPINHFLKRISEALFIMLLVFLTLFLAIYNTFGSLVCFIILLKNNTFSLKMRRKIIEMERTHNLYNLFFHLFLLVGG